jgi:hypothetical protein
LETKDIDPGEPPSKSLAAEPNRFRSLLGKARAAKEAGDAKASQEAFQKLLVLVSQADRCQARNSNCGIWKWAATILTNVVASVGPVGSPPLLGQSFYLALVLGRSTINSGS